ncbi:MAG: hypothetical protein AAF567_23250, partial [Actinomycetota bacterium]
MTMQLARTRRSSSKRALMLLVLLAMVAAACGGGSSGTAPATDLTQQSTLDQTPEPTAAPAETATSVPAPADDPTPVPPRPTPVPADDTGDAGDSGAQAPVVEKSIEDVAVSTVRIEAQG